MEPTVSLPSCSLLEHQIILDFKQAIALLTTSFYLVTNELPSIQMSDSLTTS